jgi:hypothetical protein
MGLCLSLSLSSCGASGLSRVDSYVVDACRLESKKDDKKWWFSDDVKNYNSSNRKSDDLDRLRSIRDFWQARATSASAAAQIDDRFRTLADVTTRLANSLYLTIDLREAQGVYYTYRSEEYRSDLLDYQSWATECSAAASRLNN